jgi:hypothetical protein
MFDLNYRENIKKWKESYVSGDIKKYDLRDVSLETFIQEMSTERTDALEVLNYVYDEYLFSIKYNIGGELQFMLQLIEWLDNHQLSISLKDDLSVLHRNYNNFYSNLTLLFLEEEDTHHSDFNILINQLYEDSLTAAGNTAKSINKFFINYYNYINDNISLKNDSTISTEYFFKIIKEHILSSDELQKMFIDIFIYKDFKLNNLNEIILNIFLHEVNNQSSFKFTSSGLNGYETILISEIDGSIIRERSIVLKSWLNSFVLEYLEENFSLLEEEISTLLATNLSLNKRGHLDRIKLILDKYSIIKNSNDDVIQDILKNIFKSRMRKKFIESRRYYISDSKISKEFLEKLTSLLKTKYSQKKTYDLEEVLNTEFKTIINSCDFKFFTINLQIYLEANYLGSIESVSNICNVIMNSSPNNEIFDLERTKILSNRAIKYEKINYIYDLYVRETEGKSKLDISKIKGYKDFSIWIKDIFSPFYLYLDSYDDTKWISDFLHKLERILSKLFGYEERYLIGKTNDRFGQYTDLINNIIGESENKLGSVFEIKNFDSLLTFFLLKKNDIISAIDDARIIKIYFACKIFIDSFLSKKIESNEFSIQQISDFIMFSKNILEEPKASKNDSVQTFNEKQEKLLFIINSLSLTKGSFKERVNAIFNLSIFLHNFDLNISDLSNNDVRTLFEEHLYKLNTDLGRKIYNFHIGLNYNISLLNDDELIREINDVFKEEYISEETRSLLKSYYNSIDKLFEDFYSPNMKEKKNIDKLLTLITKFNMLLKFNSIKKYIKVAEKKNENLFKLNYEIKHESNLYRFRVLEDYDPYHFQVGADTNCCQIIGGAGENAAIDSFINPLAGVILLEVYNKDINYYELLCQSYFHYIPKDNGIILDNIENTNNAIKIGNALISNIYKIYAQHLREIGFKYVYCGSAYTKILDQNIFENGELKADPRVFDVSNKLKMAHYTDFNHERFLIL